MLSTAYSFYPAPIHRQTPRRRHILFRCPAVQPDSARERANMNGKILILFVVVFCGYFGYRHIASANAAKALAQVPANPGGMGGMESLQPTREPANSRQPNRHTVFIFSANWCPGCRSLEGYLPAFLEARKDVAIR